uniref:Uncharacterized protein n=1 Tax=Corethron hystrix TaxID=216773 RepID=A0A7S1B9I3_9STRA
MTPSTLSSIFYDSKSNACKSKFKTETETFDTFIASRDDNECVSECVTGRDSTLSFMDDHIFPAMAKNTMVAKNKELKRNTTLKKYYGQRTEDYDIIYTVDEDICTVDEDTVTNATFMTEDDADGTYTTVDTYASISSSRDYRGDDDATLTVDDTYLTEDETLDMTLDTTVSSIGRSINRTSSYLTYTSTSQKQAQRFGRSPSLDDSFFHHRRRDRKLEEEEYSYDIINKKEKMRFPRHKSEITFFQTVFQYIFCVGYQDIFPSPEISQKNRSKQKTKVFESSYKTYSSVLDSVLKKIDTQKQTENTNQEYFSSGEHRGSKLDSKRESKSSILSQNNFVSSIIAMVHRNTRQDPDINQIRSNDSEDMSLIGSMMNKNVVSYKKECLAPLKKKMEQKNAIEEYYLASKHILQKGRNEHQAPLNKKNISNKQTQRRDPNLSVSRADTDFKFPTNKNSSAKQRHVTMIKQNFKLKKPVHYP